MADEPQLVKISATAYGCSKCPDFKIIKLLKKTEISDWEQSVVNTFVDHFRKRHDPKR